MKPWWKRPWSLLALAGFSVTTLGWLGVGPGFFVDAVQDFLSATVRMWHLLLLGVLLAVIKWWRNRTGAHQDMSVAVESALDPHPLEPGDQHPADALGILDDVELGMLKQLWNWATNDAPEYLLVEASCEAFPDKNKNRIRQALQELKDHGLIEETGFDENDDTSCGLTQHGRKSMNHYLENIEHDE